MSATTEGVPPDSPEFDDGLDAPAAGGPAGSVLSHLQHTRDEIVRAETKPLTLVVPRWKGALGIRYQYPEAGSDAIVDAVERAQNAGAGHDQLLEANSDVLIACCADVVGRVPGGKWQPLDATNPAPLRITSRLANLLGIAVPDNLRSPGRYILRNVFSPKGEATGIYEGDLSLMSQSGRVITWLNDGEDRADERLSGE